MTEAIRLWTLRAMAVAAILAIGVVGACGPGDDGNGPWRASSTVAPR